MLKVKYREKNLKGVKCGTENRTDIGHAMVVFQKSKAKFGATE